MTVSSNSPSSSSSSYRCFIAALSFLLMVLWAVNTHISYRYHHILLESRNDRHQLQQLLLQKKRQHWGNVAPNQTIPLQHSNENMTTSMAHHGGSKKNGTSDDEHKRTKEDQSSDDGNRNWREEDVVEEPEKERAPEPEKDSTTAHGKASRSNYATAKNHHHYQQPQRQHQQQQQQQPHKRHKVLGIKQYGFVTGGLRTKSRRHTKGRY